MWSDLPLFPQQASSIAGRVDELYLFLVAVAGFFSVLIFTLVFIFAIRYRRRFAEERPKAILGSLPLELLWTVVPLGLTMVMFAWGTWLYFRNLRIPAGTMEVYVVGKQWMWKLQHPEGPSEINELHVPVNVPVRLVMTSEDVIHSFYVPAFRIKQDVLPGRYTSIWFHPTRPGKYHLFCAEYCGTQHSGMGGWVYVMSAPEYQEWLTGGGSAESMASKGQTLYERLGCNGCHLPDGRGRGPSLAGLPGRKVMMDSGGTVVADEGYIRESILNPRAKLVAGYKAIMPTFQGQVSEDQLMQLLAYIKSQKPAERTAAE